MHGEPQTLEYKRIKNFWAEYKFNNEFHYVIYQGAFVIIGLVLMIILSKLPHEIYYKHANKLLLIALILLILVLIPGIGSVRNGSRSWFGIGGFGVQPSEFAKTIIIIFLLCFRSHQLADLLFPFR